jgi:hydrogenase-4 component F
MSGVLLSVAMYAILRYRTITDAVIGPAYTRTLLITAGLASLAVAAVLLIAQRDYKRLLAYSSIEHMGLIAVGAAIGTKLALAAVLLHVLGHGLAKAAAFAGAGQLLHHSGSPLIRAIHGLTAREPALAAMFGIALIALLGLPPFSLFASELGIARAGITAGYGWAIAIAFLLVLMAFGAIARHSTRMLLGGPPPPSPQLRQVRAATLIPLGLALAVTAALGITLGPLQQLLDAAAANAGGR